jgi:hypothetical protein
MVGFFIVPSALLSYGIVSGIGGVPRMLAVTRGANGASRARPDTGHVSRKCFRCVAVPARFSGAVPSQSESAPWHAWHPRSGCC